MALREGYVYKDTLGEGRGWSSTDIIDPQSGRTMTKAPSGGGGDISSPGAYAKYGAGYYAGGTATPGVDPGPRLTSWPSGSSEALGGFGPSGVGEAGDGGGSSGRQGFFTPDPNYTAPGEINYQELARMMLGGGDATDIAAMGLKEQQSRLAQMDRYEKEKFGIIGEQKKLVGIDPTVQDYMRRQAREGIRGAQAARGVFSSGTALEQEAYLMPQVEQGIKNWQLQALQSISGQIDPLIMSTMKTAGMYNTFGN